MGMNVPVPLTENPDAFYGIIGGCVAVGGLVVARFWHTMSPRAAKAASGQHSVQAALASKWLLSNIVAVDHALKTCGFRTSDVAAAAGADFPRMQRRLEEALGHPISDAELQRVRELLPALCE